MILHPHVTLDALSGADHLLLAKSAAERLDKHLCAYIRTLSLYPPFDIRAAALAEAAVADAMVKLGKIGEGAGDGGAAA